MRAVPESCTILIPRPLTNSDHVEALYRAVAVQLPASAYVFDMRAVDFITPSGVIALVMAARRLAEQSGHAVALVRMCAPVHRYLEGMNVFAVTHPWLQPAPLLDDAWTRNPATPNLLELTLMTGSKDVEVVMTRAEQMFQRWLRLPEIQNVLSVLSEVCANVYQHSGDSSGCVLIQKYEVSRSMKLARRTYFYCCR